MRMAWALLAVALAGPAAAQDQAPPLTIQVASPILTVDQERLFAESLFGKRVGAALDTRSRALAAENRAIEADLKAEEQALTDARAGLPPDQFRARADAFDAKVQQIRAERDKKAADLAAFRDSEQKRFSAALGDIFATIARQREAVAVMDRRAMLISADSIDITDDAVKAVDAKLGDGAADAPK